MLGIAWPLATQLAATQQPPAAHTLLGQHAWPACPHIEQVPLATHTWALAQLPPTATQERLWVLQQPAAHLSPGQQAPPGMPHTTQTLLLHAAPIAVQVLLAQHGSPRPPHFAHTLPAQVVPPAVQVPPMQHG